MFARLGRAFALSLLMLFGFAGAAAAQTTTYNFTFTSFTTNGGGLITANTATGVIQSISNFMINGSLYSLNTTGNNGGNIGRSPKFAQVSAPAYFNSGTSFDLFVTNGSSGYDFHASSASKDSADRYTFSGGGYSYSGSTSALVTESLTAVAAPRMGGGLISWLIAALGLGSFAAWRWLRMRGAPSLALHEYRSARA